MLQMFTIQIFLAMEIQTIKLSQNIILLNGLKQHPALLIFDFFIRIEMQILGRNVDGMKRMEALIFIGFRHLQEDKFVTQLKH